MPIGGGAGGPPGINGGMPRGTGMEDGSIGGTPGIPPMEGGGNCPGIIIGGMTPIGGIMGIIPVSTWLLDIFCTVPGKAIQI